jgi:hypothetical protein
MLRASVFAAFFAALAPVFVFAQGGDGRPTAPVQQKVAKIRSLPRAKVRRIATVELKPVKPPAPVLGTLSAAINEADSRVYLSSPTNPDASLVYVSPRRQSVYWRMLPPGRYSLTVKKPGFHEEVRTVDVAARGRHWLSINLRPEMAFLTVNTNLSDAEIEIEKVGKFRGGLKKYLLKPGRYTIRLARRGYAPQTMNADLSVAGKEQNIYAVLQALPIETVLSRANELVARGQVDSASLLVDDVLLMNPAHARANLLAGSIKLQKGDLSAADYFLKAIIGGESVILPARIFSDDSLIDVDVAIDRDSVGVRNAGRVDLNFRITRTKLEEMNRSPADTGYYVSVRGESDFFGRTVRPNVKLFPRSAEVDLSSLQVVCREGVAVAKCAGETDILFKVISGWREMDPAASKRHSQ